MYRPADPSCPTGDELARWWVDRELSGDAPGTTEGPAWLCGLEAAHADELSFRLDQASQRLAACDADVPPGPFRNVHALLTLRVLVRRATLDGLESAVGRVRALLERLPETEAATAARAWHLLAVASIRLNRLDDAEVASHNALGAIGDAPARSWILDTWGQIFVGTGAWEEARRTFRAVISDKEARGDALGVAISAGNVARMELLLGNPEAARAALGAALEAGREAAPLSRLRLSTLLLEASLDLRDATGTSAMAVEVARLLDATAAQPHYLRGYACLALARHAVVVDSDHAAAARWLAQAESSFTLPDHLAWARVCGARLGVAVEDEATWILELSKVFRTSPVVLEAEVFAYALCAGRAAASSRDSDRDRFLALAYDACGRANNPLWLEAVDRIADEIDPTRAADRFSRRFAGRSAEELRRTVQEDATIIFADLVGFTARSQELPPEDVMATSRAVFQLAVPGMVRHKVRPVSYLGDGLLAIAQGEGHALRGLRFATDLVARAGRASRARTACGERWGLELRAGVASGPVVLGVLGTALKQEFAVIGRTTNLAARLQSAAQPGEVVCELGAANAGVDRAAVEWLELKGFPDRVGVVRTRPDPGALSPG